MTAMRQGDWLCPACGNHNFASRDACYRCSGPRPAGSAGFGAAQRGTSARYRLSPYESPSPASPSATPSSRGTLIAPTGLREGDWICTSCGNHNFSHRDSCNKCLAPKAQMMNGSGIAAVRLNVQVSNGHVDGGPMMAPSGLRGGDWICPQCHNHNFAFRDTCNRCQTPQAGFSSTSHDAAALEKGPPLAPTGLRDGDWICNICHNHNFAHRGACNRCQSAKGASMSDPGWDTSPSALSNGYALQVDQATLIAPTGMQDGDWICALCNNHNFKSRQQCNRCQSPRASSDAAALSQAAPLRAPLDVSPAAPHRLLDQPPMIAPTGMRDGDWICSICNNHNFANRVVCNKCQEPRGVTSPPVPHWDKGTLVAPSGMQGGDWICPACGNHNFKSRHQCNRCQTARPAATDHASQARVASPRLASTAISPDKGALIAPSGLREGDWLCQACNNHNFANRQQCNRCQTPKAVIPSSPAPPMAPSGMRDGDWLCPACRNHNFANRMVCNKCQVPRPSY